MPAVEPKRGLRHFGYYWGDSDRYGHLMDEYADYASFTFIAAGFYDWPGLVPHARRAHALGLKVAVDVSLCFFDWVSDGHYRVKDKWEIYFRDVCTPALREVANAADVFAFYVMDEPIGNGLSQRDVETAIFAVKQAFPGYRTWITENPWDNAAPEGIDLYSIDCHVGWMCQSADPTCLAETWNWCKGRIARALASAPASVDFMVTIEAFGSGSFDPTSEQQWMWEREFGPNPRFIGLAWFMYPDAPDVSFRGTRSYPAVKKQHREAARFYGCQNDWEILRVCGTDCVTYRNPDRARCAGATIAHYGPC